MTYDVLGPGALDYLPCRYGTSKLLFRGPRRNLERPHFAFLGGTETYGRFIETPFPALVEEAVGKPCVNFGQPNAGIDAFAHDPFVLRAASAADIAVIQIVGAQNMTNRFYTVHPRRNDRFVAPSMLLSTIFREVDFSAFHFTKHMLTQLQRVSPERFAAVRHELQQAWLARMRLILGQIRGKVVLLWLADHAPFDNAKRDEEGLGPDPLFITREMLDDISEHATATIEVVASDEAMAAGTDGMIFSQMEEMVAAEIMGPGLHREAADAVIATIRAMR